MIKRITSLLICFTVAAGLFSFTAAAEANDKNSTYEKAAQKTTDQTNVIPEAPKSDTDEDMPMSDDIPQNARNNDPQQQYRQDQMPDMNGNMPVPPEFDGEMPFRVQNGDRGRNAGMTNGRGQGGERFPNMQQPQPFEQTENTAASATSVPTQNSPMTFGEILKTYSTPIFSVFLLAAAFIFVIFYKRKNF